MHQVYAGRTEKDVFDHQLQVLLREPAGSLDMAFGVIVMQRAWKNRTARRRRRTLLVIARVLTVSLLFTVASVFVAKVATKS